MSKVLKTLSTEQMKQFETEGYLIVKEVFHPGEVDEIRLTFDEIGQTTIPGHFEPDLSADRSDPLKRFPVSCIRIGSIRWP